MIRALWLHITFELAGYAIALVGALVIAGNVTLAVVCWGNQPVLVVFCGLSACWCSIIESMMIVGLRQSWRNRYAVS